MTTVFPVLLAAALAGCGHAQPAAVESDLGGGVTETVKGDEIKKAFDLNGDNKPDAFEYYKRGTSPAGKPADALVRKAFDLNGDGKIDFIRWYDDKGQVTKESNDTDFDGKVDVVTDYENGRKNKEERAFDAKGHAREWVYFEKNQIVRKERARHAADKVDYWEYWENGVLDRIAFDNDGDGKVDLWEKNPATQGDGASAKASGAGSAPKAAAQAK